jgi:hypothetical protein
MQTFSSAREAKEYLIAQIVAEADRSGMPLSDTERKMMYFTETAWTLSDISEVSEAFDREYDQPTYEAKIGRLAQGTEHRAHETNDLKVWKDAVQTLSQEDHYLLVLLAAQPGSPSSLLMDRVKLVGSALLICALILAGIILFSARR